MNRSTVLGILSGAFLLLTLISIADSLAHPGPRCDECGGVIRFVKHRNDEWIEATFFRCEMCGEYTFEHILKDGRDPF